MTEESLEIERRGYIAGNNPFMGEWKQTFNFQPVSYSNKSELKQEFKQKLRSELNNSFVYFHQVTLAIILYLNHEKILETQEFGDLDNYAKSICDALKGKQGIMIDDCQIQRLDISWIDVPKESYFEIELRSSPDDFMPAELQLYEMPDQLYYPVSSHVWDNGNIRDINLIDKYAELMALAAMTSAKRTLRHEMRQNGIPQFRAFQNSRLVSPLKWAFHPTRVIDSGHQLISRTKWESEFKEWSIQDENLANAIAIEAYMVSYRKMLES